MTLTSPTLTDPWALLDTGLWFVFAVWAFAVWLCRPDPVDPAD